MFHIFKKPASYISYWHHLTSTDCFRGFSFWSQWGSFMFLLSPLSRRPILRLLSYFLAQKTESKTTCRKNQKANSHNFSHVFSRICHHLSEEFTSLLDRHRAYEVGSKTCPFWRSHDESFSNLFWYLSFGYGWSCMKLPLHGYISCITVYGETAMIIQYVLSCCKVCWMEAPPKTIKNVCLNSD